MSNSLDNLEAVISKRESVTKDAINEYCTERNIPHCQADSEFYEVLGNGTEIKEIDRESHRHFDIVTVITKLGNAYFQHNKMHHTQDEEPTDGEWDREGGFGIRRVWPHETTQLVTKYVGFDPNKFIERIKSTNIDERVEQSIEVMVIRFGDNDFYQTYVPLLNAINAQVQNVGYGDTLELDKTKLVKTINELAYPMYLLHQNNFSYNAEKTGSACERTRKYLTITEDQLLLNEDAEKWLSETEWDNSDSYYIYFTPGGAAEAR